MKIALLSQSYPPMVSGAAGVVQGLAEQLAERGNEVMVLTASDRSTPYMVRGGNLILTRVCSCRNPLRVGQRFAPLPHGEIMASLRTFHPDIIHTHDPLQFAHSGLLYGRRAGVPVAITVHQLPWFVKAYLPDWGAAGEILEQGLWAYSRWMLYRCNAVVTPTRTIAGVIAAHTGIVPQVIGFGIDPEVFRPGTLEPEEAAGLRTKLGIPERVPIVLHVGRLDRDKRVDIAIRAAARAMERRPAHLLVVGDGTERDRLVGLCADLGIGERSHFTGFVTLEQGLADLYRLASVFVTASEIETQGLVLLEAAACGLPIAAVTATCIPEIVHQGLNGWLARPKDVEDLAACLRRLLSDPVQAQAMGQAGRLIVRGCVIQKTIDAHEVFYRQVIERSQLVALSPGTAWPGPAKRSGVSD